MTDNDTGQAVNKKSWQHFIRTHGLSILMGLILVILLVKPEAKSWVMQQMMRTGFYNVQLQQENSVSLPQLEDGFNFEDENGMIRHTSSLHGKVVFINFWASWCPPCRAEFPSIEALYAKFKNNNKVFFLMINEDNDLATGRAFLTKEKYITPLYTIKSSLPSDIYNLTLPTTVVLDMNGKVIFRHEGFANYASANFIEEMDKLAKD